MTGRPPGPVTIDRAGRCTECGVPMVRFGNFLDCTRCGRTVHVDELEVRRG